MNNIQIFKHKMFGEIRTMTDEKGETFFSGKDVARALGYKNTRDALNKHVDSEDKGVAKCDTLGGGAESGNHQRERTLLPDSFLTIGAGEGVQALGDLRGAASDSQDGQLHPY